MQPRCKFSAASLVAIFCDGLAMAQEPPSGANTAGAAPVRSPEITQDAKATFRLLAPNAVSVTVRNSTGGFADWPGGNDVTMTKGDDGVWSVTIGPLKPEYYTYSV